MVSLEAGMNEMEALMMTKVDVVRAEMVKAMKAGDKERKNALFLSHAIVKEDAVKRIEECHHR